MAGKHSKKRKRNGPQADEAMIQPLGTVPAPIYEDAKDEEETRLEAMLFGTNFTIHDLNASKRQQGLDDGGDFKSHSGELDNVMDSDLFFFDDAGSSAVPGSLIKPLQTDITEENVPTRLENFNVSSKEAKSISTGIAALATSKRKKAAWVDPDDNNIQVSLSSNKRLRKLRDTSEEDTVGGRDYEARLRRQYEKIQPVPNWASTARNRGSKKRRRSSESGESDEEGTDFEPILSTSGGLLTSPRKQALPSGLLSMERLRDADQSARAEDQIKSVKFHPSPAVSVLLTASSDRRLRLFNIDGHSNPHLQTVHVPSLPITTAMFHPSGSSVLLTGHRPFYYLYDLQNGTCTQSPRGLWGVHTANQDTVDLSMEICAFSPTGEILAVAGRRGYVHIIDWRRGGGQVVGSVKMNSAIKDLWWTAEQHLMTLADNSEVYLWDAKNHRCLRRWKEEGGFGSVTMTGSSNNRYLSIGSNTGIVTVYGSEAISADQDGTPKPLKTIGNLTTSISTMRFNHDAQILAIASKNKGDQLKMVHLPSLTVFSNWPTATTPLGHVTSLDFSPGSEYTAIGNTRGKVLLYNLRDFSSK